MHKMPKMTKMTKMTSSASVSAFASAPTPAPPSFLALPPNVRARIYKLAGLVRPCVIDLCEWTKRSATVPDPTLARCWRRNMAHQPAWRLCRCAPLPVALLRVCRQVHAEVVAVLYGQNRFAIRARSRQPELLDLLLRLPPAGVAHMTGLLVRLNCWPCPRGHEEVIESHADPDREHAAAGKSFCLFCDSDGADADPVLRAQGDEGMLAAWDRVCSHLATSLSLRRGALAPAAGQDRRQGQGQGQLDLTLVCDVDGLATARRLVEPMKQLPRLKSCTMRLGRKRDSRLSQFVRDTALALACETETDRIGTQLKKKKPFPFRELPPELRIRILESTHLGPPEVAGYEPLSGDIEIKRGKMISAGRDSAFETRCCGNCTETYMDCCCPAFYAAVAPRCTCRILPTDLFLVDRQMYEEAALQVFYPRTLFSFRNDSFTQTLDMLSSLTPAALHSMRRLRFVVTHSQFNEWGPHAVADWRRLVAFIGERMDLPKLSVTVDMVDCVWDQLEDYLMLDDLDPMVSFRHAYDMYIDIATVMCSLKDLGKVGFQLGAFEQLAPWLEREVLGDRFTGFVEVEAIGGTTGRGGGGGRRRRRREQMIPTYHDVNKRLDGSNYHARE